MAKVLADRDIRKLIGTVIIGADESRINPNGIELRLGKHVQFHTTNEDKQIPPGHYLKVQTGEAISIASLESLDLRAETVQRIFPGAMLMGLITPTTTMMREGISQAATKIDAGFHGTLNWGLRNSSNHDVILAAGEPIFKVTFMLLEGDEMPEVPYGGRASDCYQGSVGIVRSSRRIPADIPTTKLVSSSFDKLDHTRRLQEAGYPYNHIGTELANLHGRFEIVSKDVLVMRDEFERRTEELGQKIERANQSLGERVDHMFDQKFWRAAGGTVGICFTGAGFIPILTQAGLSASAIGILAIAVGGVLIYISIAVLGRRTRHL